MRAAFFHKQVWCGAKTQREHGSTGPCCAADRAARLPPGYGLLLGYLCFCLATLVCCFSALRSPEGRYVAFEWPGAAGDYVRFCDGVVTQPAGATGSWDRCIGRYTYASEDEVWRAKLGNRPVAIEVGLFGLRLYEPAALGGRAAEMNFYRFGHSKAYRFLLSRLLSPVPAERSTAAAFLSCFAYRDGNLRLVKAYRREAVVEVKLSLLRAMESKYSSVEVHQLLRSIVESGRSDDPTRSTAASVLSGLDPPGVDSFLLRFRKDPDESLRDAVSRHFGRRDERLWISPQTAVVLLEKARNLIQEDKADKVLAAGAVPETVGRLRTLDARIQNGILVVRMSAKDGGGYLVNPDGKNRAPGFGDVWINPTERRGVMRYLTMRP